MISREEARKAPKENTDHIGIYVETKKFDKATKKSKVVKECLHVFVRKCIPAHQSRNFTYDSYEWMISEDSCPAKIKFALWKKMSKKERLETHLMDCCHDMGGRSFTYEVLPD